MSSKDRQRMAASAILFTKLRWKREIVQGKDFSRKVKLKWAAIQTLPTEALRREALVTDPYVPFELHVPKLTPPLLGFKGLAQQDEEEIEAAALEAAKAAVAASKAPFSSRTKVLRKNKKILTEMQQAALDFEKEAAENKP